MAEPIMPAPASLPDLADLSTDQRIDVLELAIIDQLPLIDLPITHRFTPGLYSRELRAPAGVIATTFIHLVEHQFIVVQGVVDVMVDDRWVRISAPYHGVTAAGTRRVVFVVEDAIWVTFHPTQATTVEAVENEIFGYRTLGDGSNVHDRFQAALKSQQLRDCEVTDRALEGVTSGEGEGERG